MNIDRNPDSHILIPISGLFKNKNPMLNYLIKYSADIYALIYSPIMIKWLSSDFDTLQMTSDDLLYYTYKQFPFQLQAPRDPDIIPLHMRKMLFDAKYNVKTFLKMYEEQKK